MPVLLYKCPKCGHETTNTSSRRCPACGYVGDWIQPGEELTYAERHGKCPCDFCSRGAPGDRCMMPKAPG